MRSRIPRVLCGTLPTSKSPVQLPEDEASHLHSVLRLRDGDPVVALDGKGHEVQARLQHRDKTAWVATDHDKPTRTHSLDDETTPLVLEVAILKGDAMSWVIEKAVEMGVRRLVPLVCDYGVVEIGKKGSQHFVERWQRIADQALKQCERLNRMKVDAPSPVLETLKYQAHQRWVAVEPRAGFEEAVPFRFLSEALKERDEIHVLVGPEGGWSPAECDAFRAESKHRALRPASLGPLVLRAETAALFVMGSALSSQILSRHGKLRP